MDFLSLLVMFWFYMGSFESIEWPNLAQQLHTCDCSAILLLQGGFGEFRLQASFATFVRLQISQFCVSGKMRKRNVLSLWSGRRGSERCLLPLPQHVDVGSHQNVGKFLQPLW